MKARLQLTSHLQDRKTGMCRRDANWWFPRAPYRVNGSFLALTNPCNGWLVAGGNAPNVFKLPFKLALRLRY